ncbi:hypothetical protein ACFVVC_01605 [Pseudarthrobacter sp. NPDC058196]|uniref:hypothetical protein n=1 Tax=Pseudarthrobacter sp. NPDC058196 TaxID=3346376 RepID=UPI0036DE8F90
MKEPLRFDEASVVGDLTDPHADSAAGSAAECSNRTAQQLCVLVRLTQLPVVQIDSVSESSIETVRPGMDHGTLAQHGSVGQAQQECLEQALPKSVVSGQGPTSQRLVFVQELDVDCTRGFVDILLSDTRRAVDAREVIAHGFTTEWHVRGQW